MSNRRASRAKRNPFPEHHFFPVPLELYESGMALNLSNKAFRRYVSYLRQSNFDYGRRTLKPKSQDEFRKMDGVSTRSAERANAELEEFGLIRVENKRPHRITLLPPEEWKPGARKRRRRGRSQKPKIDAEIPVPTWDEINGRTVV